MAHSREKRILFSSLTGFPSKHEGGSNRIIYEIIRALHDQMYSCEYVSYRHQKKYHQNYVDDTQDERETVLKRLYQLIPFYKDIISSELYYDYYFKKLEYFFKKQSGKIQFDLLHAHHPISLSYFISKAAPKILTIHSKGGFAHESKIKKHFSPDILKKLEELERRAFECADRVTFPSIAAKELFFRINDVSCSDEKIRVIYNGVDGDSISAAISDEKIFNRFNIRSNAKHYLLNVAEHAPQKNISFLIDVMNVLVKELRTDVVFINVGMGKDTDELLMKVKNYGLSNNVYFLGKLPNTEVLALMKRCDIFILASKEVVFDLVVLEALACGMAVFVSNDGGNKEVIRNGFNGYLIETQDAKAVAAMVLQSEKSGVRDNAKKTAQQFSVASMVAGYEDVYNELLQ
jgi:glycosyltransferase involved in cell wall biosynthesis